MKVWVFRVSLVWMILLVSESCQHFQFLKQNTADNPDREIILFDGESLEGWKITSWKYRGEVKVEDGMLRLGKGHECTGVTWKKEFPEINYEVTLDAKRVKGSDFFCGMTFPVENEFCTLIVGGWGGSLVGLSSIDGFDASENATSTHRNFDNDRWYHIRLRVTEHAIEAWIDEDKVVDFNTEDHRLSVRMEVMWSRPFGVCTWRTSGAFRDIKVRYPVESET
ncbi:MAG: DUF1080 domain-containing protein [Bacteroidales bacterium]